MSGKRSKALRRQVYGDQSLQNPRRYVRYSPGNQRGGYLINAPDSLRARYQAAKRGLA